MDLDSNSQKIKIIREKLGYSQTDFCKELSLPQPYISAMESGKKSISVKLCVLLLNRFNVNTNWLLSGTGNSDEDIFLTKKNELPKNASYSPDFEIDLSNENDPLKKKMMNVLLWVKN